MTATTPERIVSDSGLPALLRNDPDAALRTPYGFAPGSGRYCPRRDRGASERAEEASMSAVTHKSTARTIERSLLAALLASGLALVVAPVARAAEVIPSMAMTRNPDAGDDTRISYGLAVRGNIAPMLAAEIGLGYRKDELFDDTVESTQWPLTAPYWWPRACCPKAALS